MRYRFACLFAGLLALAPVQAVAQGVPLAFTGPAAEALARSATTPGIDADEAAAILKVLLSKRNAYGQPEPGAQDKALLERFATAREPFAVMLDGRSTMIGPLLPDGGRFMQLAVGGAPDNLNLWQSTNPEIRLHVIRIYTLDVPAFSNAVEAMVTNDLQAAWANSSLGNSYEPLRKSIGNAVRLLDTTTPENRKAGRGLIVTAMKAIDQRASDAVPDYLYNWVAEP